AGSDLECKIEIDNNLETKILNLEKLEQNLNLMYPQAFELKKISSNALITYLLSLKQRDEHHQVLAY
ncbi:MAG: hypothetical protein AAGK97_10610, partial [Bacteroidota bacterium]